MQCRVCWGPSVLSICTKCNDDAKEQARIMERNSQQPFGAAAPEEKEEMEVERTCKACPRTLLKNEHEVCAMCLSEKAPASSIRAAELRERWWQVYLAAITGLMSRAPDVDCGIKGLVHDAGLAANLAIAALPEMEADMERIIAGGDGE